MLTSRQLTHCRRHRCAPTGSRLVVCRSSPGTRPPSARVDDVLAGDAASAAFELFAGTSDFDFGGFALDPLLLPPPPPDATFARFSSSSRRCARTSVTRRSISLPSREPSPTSGAPATPTRPTRRCTGAPPRRGSGRGGPSPRREESGVEDVAGSSDFCSRTASRFAVATEPGPREVASARLNRRQRPDRRDPPSLRRFVHLICVRNQ